MGKKIFNGEREKNINRKWKGEVLVRVLNVKKLLNLSKKKKQSWEDRGGSQTQREVGIMGRNEGLVIRNHSNGCEVETAGPRAIWAAAGLMSYLYPAPQPQVVGELWQRASHWLSLSHSISYSWVELWWSPLITIMDTVLKKKSERN